MKYPLLYLSVLAGLCACNPSPQPTSPSTAVDSTATVASPVPDSTQLGVGYEHGMSTFALISTQGDTLLLSRTTDAGAYSTIAGSLDEEDSFAITTTDQNNSLLRAINITEVKGHVKDYSIHNATLYLKDKAGKEQPVNIISLNEDSLVVVFPDSTIQRFE